MGIKKPENLHNIHWQTPSMFGAYQEPNNGLLQKPYLLFDSA